MLKRVEIILLGLFVACATPLSAELRYTILTEEHQVTLTNPANPSGTPAMKTAPESRLDTYLVGARGARLESSNVDEFTPVGGVMLGLPDGTVVMLNPTDHTFWRYPALPQAQSTAVAATGSLLSQMKPEVSITHTGEFSTILGVRVERVTWESKMNLPVVTAGVTPYQPAAGAPPIPAFPTSITTTGERWVTDEFSKYAGLADHLLVPAKAALATMMGTAQLQADGFVMREITRVTALGVGETESIVTQLTEEDASPDLFQIPANYHEIPFPTFSRQTAPPSRKKP